MSTPQVQHITSRDNAFLKDLRRLSQDSTAYRKQGQFWVEGDHLCRAAVARGVQPLAAVFSETFWPLAPVQLAQAALKNLVIPDALFSGLWRRCRPFRNDRRYERHDCN